MPDTIHGIIAEFKKADDLSRAVEAAQQAGYTHLDAFSPFPLRDEARALGINPRIIPWIAALAGICGAGIQYGAQYWMNAVDYPINVGGRPLNSWPAFIPSTLIVGLLWAGAAALIAMLIILRLPCLNHPVFAVRGFVRASEDRFFLMIRQDDPLFEPSGIKHFLSTLDPLSVQEAPACD